MITLRRKQRLVLGDQPQGSIFMVQSGCLTVHCMLAGSRRQIVHILYAGDVFALDAVPYGLGMGMTAVAPSRILRGRGAGGAMVASIGEQTVDLAAAAARLSVRSSLLALMIGRCTGEESLATVLIEMAVLLGRPVPGGYTFELPLRRDDLADYLALNRDTLSRLLSRLRARDIISMPKRGWLIIKNFDALAAMTPLAEAARSLTPITLPAVHAPADGSIVS